MDALLFVATEDTSVAKLVADAVMAKKMVSVAEDDHPLSVSKPSVIKVSSNKKANASVSRKTTLKSTPVSKPLLFDPLTNFATGNKGSEINDALDADEVNEDLEVKAKAPIDEHWKEMEADVLETGAKTRGRIKVSSAFVDILQKMGNPDMGPLTSPAAKLEFLENGGKKLAKNLGIGKDDLDITLLKAFGEQLNNQLAKFWKDDQRVAVVKLAIQVSKLLGEPSCDHLAHYPSLYFVLTDVITYFSQLVYDRLVTKCPDLKINFTFSDVNDQARELCKNWIYKVASIRELVPRFYLETALLKIYKFSCESDGLPALVERLSLMARGIGNPIVASYARMYLIHTVQQVAPSATELLLSCGKQNYDEFVVCYKYHHIVESEASDSHDGVYAPAIKWLIDSQVRGLTMVDHRRDKIIKRCFNEIDSLGHPTPIIINLLGAASPNFITTEASQLTRIVAGYCKNFGPQAPATTDLICSYIKSLIRCKNDFLRNKALTTQILLNVLNNFWRVVMKINDIRTYIRTAEVFVEFVTAYFGYKELDVLLSDILTHVAAETSTSSSLGKECSKTLSEICKVSVEGSGKSWCPIQSLANLENLVPVIDHIDNSFKIPLAKNILEQLKNTFIKDGDQKITEPVAMDGVLYLCTILSGSIDALTIQDETRQISHLIIAIITRVDYEEDFESQLKFFTECRGKFRMLDLVQVQLVHSVLSLASNVFVINQRHNVHQRPKIRGFLQACCAYCYVTIPSIPVMKHQLKLYVLNAQVGYLCKCYGQGNASIKACVDLVGQCSPNKDLRRFILTDFGPNLISYLLLLPHIPEDLGDEEVGNIKLVSDLLDACELFTKEPDFASNAELKMLQVKALDMLAVSTWDQYPYHISGFDSNDVLIRESDDTSKVFKAQVNRLSSAILSKLCTSVDESPGVALAALTTIIHRCNFERSNPAILDITRKAWKSCQKHPPLKKAADHILRRANLKIPSGKGARLLEELMN